MAKFMGPRFKQCRRLGLNVCGHPKAMDRATKGTSRADKKLSPYGIQLLEKQRLKAYYGILEKQFSNYVKKATKDTDPTGYALLKRLECRLDNLVYRLGFANSIRQARQMVVHGHILINNKKVDIPSYSVEIGEVISLKESSRNNLLFKDNFINSLNQYNYLSKDYDNFSGNLLKYPEREEIPILIDEISIVEFYSNH